jgi:PPOX class probable FMN-dependent enzyme
MTRISTVAELEALYPSPAPRTLTKIRDHLDAGFVTLVESSPFVLLATADAEGRCDVSPRGGPPGFVKVLDANHVALPDLNGNHLLDSLRNLLVNPHAALLVMLPGQDETLRVEGVAHITTDDEVLDLFVDELRRPAVAVVIDVVSAYTHCAKAFRRGRVWSPESWPHHDRSPFLAARHAQVHGDGLTDQSVDDYIATNTCKIDDDLAADAPIG